MNELGMAGIGHIVQLYGQTYEVMSSEYVKPGKGTGFMVLLLRNTTTSEVMEKVVPVHN